MNENNREPLAFQLPDENQYAPPEQVKPIEKSTRKKSVAICLAVFLGVLGVHNFYLGFTRKGVLQLLCAFIGISTIWALIDLVMMIFKQELYDADGNLVE